MKKSHKDLLSLVNSVNFSAVDVGAREGVNEDLLLIASGVNFYGFEPDPEECENLNSNTVHPWKSLTFIPSALSAEKGDFELNLYSHRGCSSKLKARTDLAGLFSREDYYEHEGTVRVPAVKLDDLVETGLIQSPAFMKVDVQGMEVDVLKGCHLTLEGSMVGVRTEVYFFPQYKKQPLFGDIDRELRAYNFVPMRFIGDIREWRRETKIKWPDIISGSLPASRGQMMHGDILYLLHPESIDPHTEEDIKRLIRLGMVSLCYDHIDHAYTIFKKSIIREYIKDHIDINIEKTVYDFSKQLMKKVPVKNHLKFYAKKWRRLK